MWCDDKLQFSLLTFATRLTMLTTKKWLLNNDIYNEVTDCVIIIVSIIIIGTHILDWTWTTNYYCQL